MTHHLVLSCLLGLQGLVGSSVEPDIEAAAHAAGRQLIHHWANDAAGAPARIELFMGDGMDEDQRRTVGEALRARLVAEDVRFAADNEGPPITRVLASCDSGQDLHRLALQVAGDPHRIEVCFVAKPWVREGHARLTSSRGARVGFAVSGNLHGAIEDARLSADELARRALRDRVVAEAGSRVPWLASTARYRDLVVAGAERALSREALPHSAIVDEFVETRDYSFGSLTRVHYLLDPGSKPLGSLFAQARRIGRAATHEVLARAGGIAFGWASLMLLAALLDRWTRGYFTWRIRGLAASLGAGLFWLLWLA